MISNDDIDTLARATAYGPDGDKLGRVGEVYLDNDTGRPAWITVVTGLFGTRRHFAPIDEAELDSSGVRLPFDKDTITGAPNIDENGELTPLEEDELYRYYRRFGDTSAEGGTTGDRGGFTDDRGGPTDDRSGLDERSAAGGGLVGGAAGGGPAGTGAPHTGESYGTTAPVGTGQSPTAGTAQSPTAGTAHSPTAGAGHSPTPPDVAREEIAGNYRPSEGQRDESLEHSMPGHTASTPSTPSGTAHSAADTARHAASGTGTGSDQEIVGPGPTGPAHFTPPQSADTDTSTADAKADTAGGADADRPRKPRLVRRVVTTEYYEESPDDATDTDRS
ncbi:MULTISPECIES: PRC-barrel domain-containing protein [Rhodococcus]|uniref:PRC-barrel domain-containing protein n=1 Tax=Rhodococcus TaxID=1827 RepID=UPI001C0EB667|nr:MULTISPECIES: PRC-barrel domain-containing protein [Rhodococcus]MCD2098006.1 PRC-barrel domain-containing protein [Rhodococcus rhodochrous]MCD2122132.1 PRC-barrel domain-containing protein [Rhodococcus rhodochrous]MCQ4133927.1 PRC-barrel domain-containing protein [Rhodococcus rhodochrous]MDJ0018996.1 PRC-barrel domain-containing protein [Rhodococcus rhodochrous]